MRVGQLYSYVFYNASMVTNMGIRHYPRLALVSTKPMLHSVQAFVEDGSVTTKMLDAAGMRYWHTLTGDCYMAMVNGPDEDGTATVEILRGPCSVASANEDYHEQVDYAPEDAIEKVFPESRFRDEITWTDMSMQDLMANAVQRLHKMSEVNKKFAFTDSDERVDRMLKMAEQLEPIVKRVSEQQERAAVDPESKAIIDALRDGKDLPAGTPMPRALLSEHGVLAQALDKGVEVNAGIYDGKDVRFVAVEATDFRKVAISSPKGLQPMEFVRVFHSAPPEWHERKADWPKELLGYWLFKDAAVGESVDLPGVKSHNMVGFVSMTNLAVVVRDADAIAPAGSMAIPMFIWEQMNPGKEPPVTMSEDEGLAYNNTHAVATDHAAEPVASRTLN